MIDGTFRMAFLVATIGDYDPSLSPIDESAPLRERDMRAGRASAHTANARPA
ncbi:hypothetical protein [Sphingomonas sp. Leaf38]|uniref:hypothetical protein n=1 Tax=Sphingomonas sp. Leaf38 TaxID=1736217 RepID=UPI000AD67CE8|nr:hypothetical protein [Sphingomonas sp. Leaf38]